MKKLFSIFSILFISYSFSGAVEAGEYLECQNCSSVEMSILADNWGLKNISDNDAENNLKKELHIVDLINLRSESYLIYKKKINTTYYIDKNRISTPQPLNKQLIEANESKDLMNAMSNDIVIPKDVIKDPWEFVGCSYCVGNLEDFFNSTLRGEISQLTSLISTIAYTVGITQAPYKQTFTLKFADGGSTTFEVTQVTNTNKFIITKILKVKDASNNEIPLDRSSANFKSLHIPSHDRWQIINDYLWRYRLSIPPTDGGVVTVTECPLAPQHNCW
ncbi:hypothetical protein [Vibrio harveyi]|uniref:hypothetical protein n=1 Tax=Vibrio harveyi TaxID=669 RepID=UPI0003F7E4F9|nr:hypothetical protein [Vibrio harveyi]